MEFKKAKIYYINPLFALYVWVRVRVMVSNIWYGIKNILLKIPVEHRDELLKVVK
ncbi:hypothetical protein QI309_11110 [Staphylococcus saprophyticus]|nr:hypothetical protein [Staphylococcus saprophyticus]